SERVGRAVDDIDETIKLIRTTIFALQERDQEFDKQSVRARVLAEVEGAARVLGFAPALRLGGPINTRVHGQIAENVIAVLREGLSNAARHAQATSIDVSLAVAADVTLRIADNGVGIPATARRRGLRNLAERAKKLDGTLVVRPGAERGTVLEWRVPLGAPHVRDASCATPTGCRGPCPCGQSAAGHHLWGDLQEVLSLTRC